MSDYEAMGGADAVHQVVTAFVQRFFDDMIIGFLFVGKDMERIVLHETEHASALLGGPSRYTGRPLAGAHKPLRINTGHFRRRLAIVRQVLGQHGVDDDIIERWIAADQRLMGVITTGQDCLPPTS